MDEASPAFCRAFAAKLRDRTGRAWSAPSGTPKQPGFYVVPEYGLDPLNWPEDRLTGVELLTPPLPLDEAETVRAELIEAIYEIDGDFNFVENDHTANCGWHINIDAGKGHRLDPDRFIVGVDELLLLANNDRLFSRYTALQRHAVGVPLLRHLAHDPTGKFLLGSALGNLLEARAGRDKGYAANFAKLDKGYLELRHFSAESFFNGPHLTEQLERIPAARGLAHLQPALRAGLSPEVSAALALACPKSRQTDVGPGSRAGCGLGPGSFRRRTARPCDGRRPGRTQSVRARRA